MTQQPPKHEWRSPEFQVVDQALTRYGRQILGLTLIVLGLSFFLAQLLQVSLVRYLWPLFILTPGLVLCYVAFRVSHETGQVLMVPGSILTMLGTLLWYQSLTGHWESWAYAWALLPMAIGLGQMVYGRLLGDANLAGIGRGLAQVFGTIFVVGFFFFEMILNISDLGIWAWSALFIGTGGYLIWRSLRAR